MPLHIIVLSTTKQNKFSNIVQTCRDGDPEIYAVPMEDGVLMLISLIANFKCVY